MRLIIFILLIVLPTVSAMAQKSGLVIYSEDESNFALQYAGGKYLGHNSYYIPIEDAGILDLYIESNNGKGIRKELPAAPSGVSIYTLTHENKKDALRYRGRIATMDQMPNFIKHDPTLLPEWTMAHIKVPEPTQYHEEKDSSTLRVQLVGQKAAIAAQKLPEPKTLKSKAGNKAQTQEAITALLGDNITPSRDKAVNYHKAELEAAPDDPKKVKFPLSKHVASYRALSEDQQRLDYVQERFGNTWMTARQIEFFISGLDNELRKLEMSKWLYPRCKDPEDFVRITDQFEFHYTKRKLKRFISNHDKKN